jgi:alpha-ketoglutaric semialdehyde dehydrogenase
MPVQGSMLIGQSALHGTAPSLNAFDPALGAPIEPSFGGATPADVDRACCLADTAYESYSRTDPELRATFLEAIAANLLALGDELVDRTMLETGLARARIEGERARTAAQVRHFASVVRSGLWRRATIVSADSKKAVPSPDMRLHKIALGPVAVFGASNFPLLYSVGGGDTASALAAGCPGIVKAHFSHLGTSELVGRAIQKAVADFGLHEGVFSLVVGAGNAAAEALVDHPAIKAVAFTGSQAGGMALVRRGQQRPEPIPVFTEMTSVNPNFVLPHVVATRGEALAVRFAEQVAAGVGQMCLKPGVLIALEGNGFGAMRSALQDAVSAKPAATMLSPGIHDAYGRRTERQRAAAPVIASGGPPSGKNDGQALLFEINADALLADVTLAEEMFGPAALLVRCSQFSDMVRIAERMPGQLTMTLQMDAEDAALAKALMPVLERKAGRIIANGFSNAAVEFTSATNHGGPFPATSDSRFTSVGSSAIDRFLRPVSYQNVPAVLLPTALRDENPYGLTRLRDDRFETVRQKREAVR